MNDYDLEKSSTFITYLDKNNLYGWSMSEYLPCGEFEWLENRCNSNRCRSQI